MPGTEKPRRTAKQDHNRSKTHESADADDETTFKVTDRRHWARDDLEDDDSGDGSDSSSTQPTLLDEYKQRMQAAEAKLQDYIAAFKQAQADQESFRARLGSDVERRADLAFGELVADLLETVDDLELALSHTKDVPEARSLAEGVALARDRFLAALARRGVQKVVMDGEEFDPNLAEAMRVDAVDDPAQDGLVTLTIRPGYRLGERMLRAAQVAVGRARDRE